MMKAEIQLQYQTLQTDMSQVYQGWLREQIIYIILFRTCFPVGSVGKETPCNAEPQVQSLDGEDPLEKEMATLQYSCLEYPMDRGTWCATEPMGLQTVGHNWATTIKNMHPNWIPSLLFFKIWDKVIAP